MNKLHPASRSPESVTRAVIRAFAEDQPVEKAMKASGLSKRQVIDLYGRLRERLAEHADDLIAKHQASEHWVRAREAYRDTARKVVLAKKAGLGNFFDRFIARVKPRLSATDPRMAHLRAEIAANPEEFEREVEAQITTFIDWTRKLYCRWHNARRRGASGKAGEHHESEARYRHSLLLMKNAYWKWNVRPTQRAFSDGTKAYTYSENVIVVLFKRSATIRAEVENDLIRMLEREPL